MAIPTISRDIPYFSLYSSLSLSIKEERSSCGVVANVLDCDIVVSEFELQSRYYIPFQTNTLGKDINTLILSAVD